MDSLTDDGSRRVGKSTVSWPLACFITRVVFDLGMTPLHIIVHLVAAYFIRIVVTTKWTIEYNERYRL